MEFDHDRFARYALLEPNWDSYGANSIPPVILQSVQEFLESLPDLEPPRMVPTSNGTIQLEWYNLPKLLEMEFETAETVHYLKWDDSAGDGEEGVFQTNNVSLATELIQWVLEGKTDE